MTRTIRRSAQTPGIRKRPTRTGTASSTLRHVALLAISMATMSALSMTPAPTARPATPLRLVQAIGRDTGELGTVGNAIGKTPTNPTGSLTGNPIGNTPAAPAGPTPASPAGSTPDLPEAVTPPASTGSTTGAQTPLRPRDLFGSHRQQDETD
jgi:hypothetical protein